MPYFNQAIVRIFKTGTKTPVGAGFLIGPNLVLTCAHVVEEALGKKNIQDKPEDTLTLDFPIIDKHPEYTATVDKWKPVKDKPVKGEYEDMALLKLKLKENEKLDCQPLKLVEIDDYSDIALILFGFPKTKDNGLPIKATAILEIGSGHIHINPDPDQGSVDPGFSGTAAYAKKLNGVAGPLGHVLNTQGKSVRRIEGQGMPASAVR